MLSRPAEQRARECKYRFAQSVVFGIPVIVLHRWGAALGPADWQRWASLLQALLSGWIIYVNLGMLFEGLMLLLHRRRVTADLVVCAVAVVLYLLSLASAVPAIVTARLWYPLLFHVCVVLLAGWTLFAWARAARLARAR